MDLGWTTEWAGLTGPFDMLFAIGSVISKFEFQLKDVFKFMLTRLE